MGKICLCFHGFTGGPFELEPLALHLQAAGYTCVLPILPGHDDPDQLRRVRWNDWIEAAGREAEIIAGQHGEFDLIGFSMGGVLAAHVANRYPVRRLVLLNAAAIYISPRRFLQEVAGAFQDQEWERLGKIKQTPLHATFQFMRVVRSAKPMWRGIQVPTLIAQSGKDPVIHPHSALVLADKIPGPKQVRIFPESKHLICLGQEADSLFNTVEQFLSE